MAESFITSKVLEKLYIVLREKSEEQIKQDYVAEKHEERSIHIFMIYVFKIALKS